MSRFAIHRGGPWLAVVALLLLGGCNRGGGSRHDADIERLFAPLGIERVNAPLRDWGKVAAAAPAYYQVAPTTVTALQGIVKTAYGHGVGLRIRGKGHSMNGQSLPKPNELLVRTAHFRQIRMTGPRTVSVGVGPSMYEIRAYLWQFGYDLPVVNDGEEGPSLGGYISAGGIGPGARKYGGFWENVSSVTLVDGAGTLRRIKRGEALFPWLFGSMGQLGVLVEAELDLVADNSYAPLPVSAGTVPELWESDPKTAAGFQGRFETSRLYWFTLFVPPAEVERVVGEFESLMSGVSGVQFMPPFVYPMKYRTFNPPLLYPYAGDFVSVGVWGVTQEHPEASLAKLETAMNKLAARPRYRRYIQSETVASNIDFRAYFGAEVFDRFLQHKKTLDPKRIINPGFFEAAPRAHFFARLFGRGEEN